MILEQPNFVKKLVSLLFAQNLYRNISGKHNFLRYLSNCWSIIEKIAILEDLRVSAKNKNLENTQNHETSEHGILFRYRSSAFLFDLR